MEVILVKNSINRWAKSVIRKLNRILREKSFVALLRFHNSYDCVFLFVAFYNFVCLVLLSGWFPNSYQEKNRILAVGKVNAGMKRHCNQITYTLYIYIILYMYI